MLPIINFYTRFTISFKTLKHQVKHIEEILNKNGFTHQTWRRTGFENVIEFRVDCNIRQAEVIRRLIKNYKTFE